MYVKHAVKTRIPNPPWIVEEVVDVRLNDNVVACLKSQTIRKKEILVSRQINFNIKNSILRILRVLLI